jgi:GNAT superfamily N-acetyltransferase
VAARLVRRRDRPRLSWPRGADLGGRCSRCRHAEPAIWDAAVGRADRVFWDTLGVRVLPASTSDLSTFLSLAEEVEEWFGPMVDDPGFRQAVRRGIGRGSALVAVDRDEPVGGLLFSRHRPPIYDIRWLVVTSDRRSEGVGEAMIAHALRRFVEPPATVSVVTFGADHPGARSRDFYTRLGFEPQEEAETGPEGGSRQRFELQVTDLPDWSIRADH